MSNSLAIQILKKIIYLKSKYIHIKFVSIFNELFTDMVSADVILVSEDQIPFQAHRNVLSASSQVLKDLLLDNFSPNLLMKQEFRSILQFMYLGEITLIEIHISSK